MNREVIRIEEPQEGIKPVEYDFYYSAEHEMHMIKMSRMPIGGFRHVHKYFKRNTFTEAIKKGEKPVTFHFKDLRKIGTGTFENDVTYSGKD